MTNWKKVLNKYFSRVSRELRKFHWKKLNGKTIERILAELARDAEGIPNTFKNDIVETAMFRLGLSDKKPDGLPAFLDESVQSYTRMAADAIQQSFSNHSVTDVPKRPLNVSSTSEGGGGKMKRHRADTDGIPVNPDDGNVTDNPGHMSNGLTSHSLEHCCIDLGTIRAKQFSFSHIKGDELSPVTKVYGDFGLVFNSQEGMKRIEILGQGTTLSSLSTSGRAPKPAWSNPVSKPFINSVHMLNDIHDKELASGTTWPLTTYGTAGVGPTGNIDSAQRAVVISKQFIEFKFKNLATAGTSTKNSPCFVTIYAVTPRRDIFAPTNDLSVAPFLNDDVERTPILREIREGFSSSLIQPALTYERDYPPFITIADNMAFDEIFEVIDTKKFCLAQGQEGTMRCYIHNPQYHNYHHWLKGEPTSVTGSSSAEQYKGVVHKPGETFFLVEFHGGLAGEGTGVSVANNCRYEAAQLGFYGFHRYEYRRVERLLTNNQQYIATKANLANLVDVDFSDYNQ